MKNEGQKEDFPEFPKLDVAASPASSLHKEISSFSQLSTEAAAAFPPSSSLQSALRFLLNCPFLGTPRRVAQNRSSPLTSEPPPSSVTELRSLVARWRKTGAKGGEEAEQVARLDHFLKELHLQKRLYLFFLKRIYAPLYRNFFELRSATGEEEEAGEAFFLTEYSPEEEEEEAERQEGSSAERLAALESRWRRVLEEDQPLASAPFEEEKKEKAEEEEGEAVGALLQLLPDLSAKCRLGVHLAFEWLTEYQRRHPEGEGESGGGGAAAEGLRVLRKALLKKEGELRRGEHHVAILEAELATLQAREEKVLALCSNCAQLEKHREELSERYAALVRERQALTEEIENTIQGTQRLRELSKQLKDLEQSITNQYGELQMVEYALNIASDDYDLQMTLQPSFFAFSRTTNDKLSRAKTQQQSRKSQLAILQKRYDKARGLVDQMNHVEAAIGGGGGGGGGGEVARPATSETYTKYRVPDRYSDAGQRSGSSSSEGGHDADEEVSEAPSPPPFPARPGPVRLVNHSTALQRGTAGGGTS